MRKLFIAALLLSLLVHAFALFGIDYGMFGEPPESVPLKAELRALPPLPVPEPSPPPRPKPPVEPIPAPAPVPPVDTAAGLEAMPARDDAAANDALATAVADEAVSPPRPPAVEPVLSGSGRLAFVVVKESLGMQIGRALHQWDFPGDGSYRLSSMIETSGLVALLKPLRQEHESFGRLVAHGLQPEGFRILRNGKPRGDNADFDWATGEVRLERDGSVLKIAPGTQDLLSLIYQLAYLRSPENGSTIGVVAGRSYERYQLDSLGEEEIETPAGRFRTLHLRAAGETLTEIWIALDRQRLPVKIRFTDKKGDSYTQLAITLDISGTGPEMPSGKP